MKIAILDARVGGGRSVEGSHTVAYRNLAILRDELHADLFINPEDIKNRKDYDVIICGFGSTSCEKEMSTRFLSDNSSAKIYWLVGEYEQSTFAPLFYSKREFEVIKNFEHQIKNKKCTKQHFLNINTLLTKQPNPAKTKKYDCIYYGRWRPDRLKYFKKYLNSYMYLSTASKNIKMFYHNLCRPKLIKPLIWVNRRETLSLFRASLYIEDEYTHNHYNCLGNRFYEALWCNVVPLFDASCINTLKKSGYTDYEWHVVRSTDDIKAKCNEIKEGNTGSLKKWQSQAVKEKHQVITAIKRLIKNEETGKTFEETKIERA